MIQKQFLYKQSAFNYSQMKSVWFKKFVICWWRLTRHFIKSSNITWQGQLREQLMPATACRVLILVVTQNLQYVHFSGSTFFLYQHKHRNQYQRPNIIRNSCFCNVFTCVFSSSKTSFFAKKANLCKCNSRLRQLKLNKTGAFAQHLLTNSNQVSTLFTQQCKFISKLVL